MRVAILSAGPRLAETFDPSEPFGARIAVNAAAAVYPCQWWCCGDAQTFARVVPPADWPAPALFTMTESDSHFRNRKSTAQRLERHRMVLWSEVVQRVHPPAEATNWSITAALALAVDLGASEVNVYGHYYEGEDESNVTDCSGYTLAKRAENRERVIRDWRVVRRWAEGLGRRIHEHAPAHHAEAAPCT